MGLWRPRLGGLQVKNTRGRQWRTFTHNAAIASYGADPFAEYSLDAVPDLVRGGLRLAAPEGTPPALEALMRACCDAVPAQRPSFACLRRHLDAAAADMQVWRVP